MLDFLFVANKDQGAVNGLDSSDKLFDTGTDRVGQPAETG